MIRVQRALLSVSDKRGVVELARALATHHVELLSTGGTAQALGDAGVAVREVADYTGSPEILDGRVKTLHPRIHAGLLARPIPEHRHQLAEHGIDEIDLLVVNLYPFAEASARPGTTLEALCEHIDIGGPAMLRGAAKNFERVTVIVDPADYPELLVELNTHQGATRRAQRFRWAAKAFAHTAAYDAMIANCLGSLTTLPNNTEAVAVAQFPATLTCQWDRVSTLRYGENPHQQAAFYRDALPPAQPSVAFADVLQGKELSYNNLLDLDAALAQVGEFSGPAAVIVKHSNPCGAAESARGLLAAYQHARGADPQSSFGGIVALNRAVDEKLAATLLETFLECIIAPDFTDGARAVLAKKSNVRALRWHAPTGPTNRANLELRTIRGGALVQERDHGMTSVLQARASTERAPSPAELRALEFAWKVVKHVRSNAIVLARADGETAVSVGIGAGQMSRVDAVRLAVNKAESSASGAVMASDAFFPFRDGLDVAAQAGVTAVIQPGGSVRDAEVIAAANAHGMTMLMTGMRHFRH